MDTSDFNTSLHTHTAIEALKIAYEECSDKTAKESIITAFKAIIQLHLHLGKEHDRNRCESDGYDPSEYCAAV
jgi:hypothetical protein